MCVRHALLSCVPLRFLAHYHRHWQGGRRSTWRSSPTCPQVRAVMIHGLESLKLRQGAFM